MSSTHITRDEWTIAEFLKAAEKECGWKVVKEEDGELCLSNGRNSVWANQAGEQIAFDVYGANDPNDLFCNFDIVSEWDDDYNEVAGIVYDDEEEDA